MQRGDRLVGVRILQHLDRHVLVQQQLEPVEQFAGAGLLLQAGHFADVVEDFHRLGDEVLLDAGEVDLDDVAHRVAVGEGDVVEEAAAQEGVG